MEFREMRELGGDRGSLRTYHMGKMYQPPSKGIHKTSGFCPCESSVECGVFLRHRQVDNEQGWASEFSNRGLSNRFPEVSMATVAGIFRCKMV